MQRAVEERLKIEQLLKKIVYSTKYWDLFFITICIEYFMFEFKKKKLQGILHFHHKLGDATNTRRPNQKVGQ